MNYDYAKTAHEEGSCDFNGAGNGTTNSNLKGFPLEKARFRSVPWLISLSVAFTCAYGWALQARLVSNSSNLEWRLIAVARCSTDRASGCHWRGYNHHLQRKYLACELVRA